VRLCGADCNALCLPHRAPTHLPRYISQHGQSFTAAAGSIGPDAGGSGAAADMEGVWQEDFEDDSGKHWAKFASCMEADPDQAIRYSWSGRAHWPHALPPAPPACPACRAPRVFECQLMPPLLRLLNVDALCLAVYCCSESCTPAPGTHGVALAQEVSETRRRISRLCSSPNG
jgi:hypothetical protein